jgi:hypothetical protein
VFLSYTINLNGCIIIKLIQWINNQLLFLKNNNNNKFISQIFSQYYENCYIHNLSYTKSVFYQEFGVKFDDFFELDPKTKSGFGVSGTGSGTSSPSQDQTLILDTDAASDVASSNLFGQSERPEIRRCPQTSQPYPSRTTPRGKAPSTQYPIPKPR